MELILRQAMPSRALQLIRDFSKPLTRPDWRSIRRISAFDIYHYVYRSLLILTPLMELIFYNMQHTNWYNMYCNLELFGIEKTSIKYNIPVEELLRIKGMREASTYHTFWGDEQ